MEEDFNSDFNASKLDYLVHNAGVGSYEPIADTMEDSLDKLYNIHFKSVFLLAKGFSAVMAEGGSLVNVSSGFSKFSAVGVCDLWYAESSG